MIKIGHTLKPHGIKGEIKFHVEDAYFDDFMETDVVFLLIKGKHTPCFIEQVRAGNSIIVKLEDINTPEEAIVFGGKEMFMREEDLIPGVDRTAFTGLQHEHCVGYTIIDEELGEIGTIQEIFELPQQEMATVMFEGKEKMIPLNPVFVKKVDNQAKTIRVLLPEGLLEL